MGKNLLGERARQLFGIDRPFAITMWDFSWLERRWPGAGYEDWDAALGELTDRGYDAVRHCSVCVQTNGKIYQHSMEFLYERHVQFGLYVNCYFYHKLYVFGLDWH